MMQSMREEEEEEKKKKVPSLKDFEAHVMIWRLQLVLQYRVQVAKT